MFLSDKKKLNAFRLNEKMMVVDTISTSRPEKKYKDIIGYSGEINNLNLFFANTAKNEIFGVNINFDKRTTDKRSYQFDFSNESFLKCFSENKKFYMMTIVQNSSVIKLYVFDGNGDYQAKLINLRSFPFSNISPTISNLYDVFDITVGGLAVFEEEFSIQEIDSDSPTTIVETAKKKKCYSNSKEIVISLDLSKQITQLITIDLKTFVPTFKEFQQKVIVGSKTQNSNSLFFENKLIQVVLSSDEMWITIKDLNNTLLKEYSASKDAEISFKNSDIIRSESPTFIAIAGERSERVLESSQQFL